MIYLDYNATTPVDESVLEAMLPYFSQIFGNPSSSQHALGHWANQAIGRSREQVASLVGVSPQSVIFTSGATEAINLTFYGTAAVENRHRVLVSSIEHKAVLEAAELHCGHAHRTVELIPVNPDGVINFDALEDLLDDHVALVAVMHANNEVGTVQDIAKVSQAVHANGAILMSDVTQSVGKIPVDIETLGIDIAALSSHKIYGPKGAGALCVSRSLRKSLAPLLAGGGQEGGLRAGTENVPGIVGFGAACNLAKQELSRYQENTSCVLNEFKSALAKNTGNWNVNCDESSTLPNTANIRFIGADAEAVMARTPDVAFATGSACQTSVPAPSHVLTAMGLTLEEARECVRISIGKYTTMEDAVKAAQLIAKSVNEVRLIDGD
jgi:cysteine desulfurase